jgi:hypothetical protein
MAAARRVWDIMTPAARLIGFTPQEGGFKAPCLPHEAKAGQMPVPESAHPAGTIGETGVLEWRAHYRHCGISGTVEASARR